MIEILTVLAIISILITALVMSFRGRDQRMSVRGAEGSIASLFSNARMVALSKGTRARVIINFDESKPELYGRKLGIIYRVEEDGAGPNDWVALDNGMLLPMNIYVIPPVGAAAQTRTDGKTSTTGGLVNGAPQFMTIDYPKATPQPGQDSSGSWLVYEFDSNGMSNNPGAQLVVAAGIIKPGTSVTSENILFPTPAMAGGFMIRRTGAVTLFQEYEDIRKVNQ